MVNFSLKKLLKNFNYNYPENIYINSLNNTEKYRWETINNKEPETIEWINNMEEDSIFLDIGANIGVFTFTALARGVKEIIALEPFRKNFITLCRNLEDNNIKNVAAFNFGIGEKTKLVSFSGSNLDSGGAEFKYRSDIHFNEYTTIFNNFNFIDNHINCKNLYIKIDVDGGEVEVLKGIENLLKNENLKSILIESSHSNTEEKVNLIMRKIGFTIDRYYSEFRPHSITRRIEEKNDARNNVYKKLNHK